MIDSTDEINYLIRFYGRGIHLYTQGKMYRGWFIVPVVWDKNLYTVSCFSPNGSQDIEWRKYHSLEDAVTAGRELVERLLTEMTSFKIRPML